MMWIMHEVDWHKLKQIDEVMSGDIWNLYRAAPLMLAGEPVTVVKDETKLVPRFDNPLGRLLSTYVGSMFTKSVTIEATPRPGDILHIDEQAFTISGDVKLYDPTRMFGGMM